MYVYDVWLLYFRVETHFNSMLCRGGLVCEVDTFLGANYGGAAWAAKSDGCAREKIGHPRFQEQRSLCGSQVRQSGDSNF